MVSSIVRAVALASLAVLAACGGDSSSPSLATVEPAAADIGEPLFDAAGRPMLSPLARLPADTAVRTRSGLYASRAQYEWQALVFSPYTLLIDVDAAGSPEAALLLAETVRANPESRGVGYFVRARRPADAADLANALGDRGFAPVFLIV